MIKKKHNSWAWVGAEAMRCSVDGKNEILRTQCPPTGKQLHKCFHEHVREINAAIKTIK